MNNKISRPSLISKIKWFFTKREKIMIVDGEVVVTGRGSKNRTYATYINGKATTKIPKGDFTLVITGEQLTNKK